MRPIRLAALAALLALAACGNSRLNPLNWFGGGATQTVVLAPAGGWAERADPRPLIGEVTQLALAPNPGGAVLTATGLAPRQGFWNGALVSQTGNRPDEQGVLHLDFHIAPPPGPTDVNRPQSREVVVGLYLSNRKLAGLREIRVRGESNIRSLRR